MAIDEAVLGAELRRRHGVTTLARLRRLGMTDATLDECLDETIEDLWALW